MEMIFWFVTIATDMLLALSVLFMIGVGLIHLFANVFPWLKNDEFDNVK